MSMVMEMKRIEAMAITMVRLAAEAGVVLTIEQVNLQPPRMNTYIALVKKVFDVQDVELKYGIIIEVI